jgi:hypothetical protein
MSIVFSQLPELRHLRCFIMVAQEQSFSRAAVKLRISQQQVSRTIQALEDLIGAPLFDRTTRQVRISPVGDIFFPGARSRHLMGLKPAFAERVLWSLASSDVLPSLSAASRWKATCPKYFSAIVLNIQSSA